MAFDLDQKTNLVVTQRGDVLTINGIDYTAPVLAALVQKLEELDLLGITRGESDHLIKEINAAAKRGDFVGAARGLIELTKVVFPWCGVKPVARAELTAMKQTKGLAAGLTSVSQVIVSQEAPSPDRDALLKDLAEQAARAESYDLLRDSFDTLDRQVGGNELALLPSARARISETVERVRPQLLNDPLLARDLAPAIDYLSGAAQRGKKTRRRNQATREEQRETLRKEVLAEGREAGRREALEGITDRVTNALKDK